MKAKLTKTISGYLTPKGHCVQRFDGGYGWYILADNGDYIEFNTLSEVREWIIRTGEDITKK